MTLKLRTHEQIHAELTRPASLKIFKAGLKLAAVNGRLDQKEAHAARLSNMLITAAAGREVFTGTNGRVLAAIVNFSRKPPRGVEDFREAGKMAKEIGTHLHFAVLALDSDRLRGFSGKEKEDLSHQMKSFVTYIQARGRFLEQHNVWHSPATSS